MVRSKSLARAFSYSVFSKGGVSNQRWELRSGQRPLVARLFSAGLNLAEHRRGGVFVVLLRKTRPTELSPAVAREHLPGRWHRRARSLFEIARFSGTAQFLNVLMMSEGGQLSASSASLKLPRE